MRMLSRARYCWPGSKYAVTLHDCSSGPPASAASAAEAHRFRSRGAAVAIGLLLVGGEPGAGLPPTFVEGSGFRPGPLSQSICRAFGHR